MYPRPDSPLIPIALRDLLGPVLVPAEIEFLGLAERPRTLADLPSDVCATQPEGTIDALVVTIVAALARENLGALRDHPVFDHEPWADDLTFSTRSRNALRFARVLQSRKARRTTIGELMSTRNFGVTCLLDVLTENDRTATGNAGQPELDHSALEAVRELALKLFNRRWSQAVFSDDPRVGVLVDSLATGEPTARDAAAAILNGPTRVADPHGVSGKLRALIDEGDRCRAMSLEDELHSLVACFCTNEAAQKALVDRLGFGGMPPITLAAAGDEIGVSRERVRQLQERFIDGIDSAGAVWTPRLTRALRILRRKEIEDGAEVPAVLREAGIAAGEFSYDSLKAAAEVFGKRFSLSSGNAKPKNSAVSHLVARDVQAAVRKLASRWGVANLAMLKQWLGETGVDASETRLRRAIEALRFTAWLDEEHGWFWIPANQNAVIRIAEKIVSVAGQIHIDQLRAGIARPQRRAGHTPSKRALAALCAASGLFEVSGDQVIEGPNLAPWEEVLVGIEKALAEALFRHDFVMQRAKLEEVATGEFGLKRPTVSYYLTFSPIIEKYATGVFGLRGAPITASEVSALIPARSRSRVFQESGVTESGAFWAAFRLSESAASTALLGTPSIFRETARGDYALFDAAGTESGRLVVQDSIWGLRSLFEAHAPEPGDFMILEIDSVSREATCHFGGRELLVRYQDA